jgi:hypothetical protein
MTNEEFDRKMAFIIEQQAQFAANDMHHRAWQAEMEQNFARSKQEFDRSKEDMDQRFARVAQALAESNDVVTRLARVTNEGFKDVNAKINALVDAQIRTDEQLRRTEEMLRRRLGENGLPQ